jgi:ABC-2 type transport system ATP-binding protein
MTDLAVLCDRLSKRYGRRVVLHALTIAVRRGAVFGLVGANGGSKTTLLRLIAGVIEPDDGRCQVLGTTPATVRHRIGYMPQALGLYGELTVRENLRARAALFDLTAPETAASVMIDRFELGGHADIRVARLSGGWARRAQLAATLIHAPELVLLDEPTVGLDAGARQQVWAQILALADAGATVVVATHDLAEAERFSGLAFLADGQVLASGRPADIVSAAGVRSFLLSGADAGAQSQSLRTIPDVVAVYPHGAALRVVARNRAAGAVRQLALDRELLAVAVASTLDDAAHALLAAA